MFISEEEFNRRLQKNPSCIKLEEDKKEEEGKIESSSELIEQEKIEQEEIEESNTNTSTGLVIPHRFRGRTVGATEIPGFLRPIIGAAARFGTIKEAAETFGISTSTAGHLAHGRVHNGESYTERPEVKSKLDSIVGKAQETAADKLLKALGCITDEKLENAKAGDLSRIDDDMSRVIEKTSDKKEVATAQILIYAPQGRAEDKYDVIEVKN